MKKLFASVFNFSSEMASCTQLMLRRDILTWLYLRHKKFDRKRNRKEEKIYLPIFIIFRSENLVHGFYVGQINSSLRMLQKLYQGKENWTWSWSPILKLF